MLHPFEASSADHSTVLQHCCLALITVLSLKCFIYSILLSLTEIICISQLCSIKVTGFVMGKHVCIIDSRRQEGANNYQFLLSKSSWGWNVLLNVPARLSDTYIKLSKILSFGTNFIDFFFFLIWNKKKQIYNIHWTFLQSFRNWF